jgi:hypothetical protein
VQTSVGEKGGIRGNMFRTILWLVAFLPLIVGFTLILIGGEYAKWAMVTPYISTPIFLIAAVTELLFFRKRGVFISSSPTGNNLAIIFGVIFLVNLVWHLYQFVMGNN